MKEIPRNEVFVVLAGGPRAASTAPPLHNPTPDAILLPELGGLGVGVRLVKATAKEIFLRDILYFPVGGPNRDFLSMEHIARVYSNPINAHCAKGVRLVRRSA